MGGGRYGLYCNYPQGKGICSYNRKWENRAADYAAGELGKEVGI